MKQLLMISTMTKLPVFKLAEGFSIRTYQPGDEKAWFDICKHGLLGDDDGIECWETCMLAMENLLPERNVFFVCDKTSNEVATGAYFIKNNGEALLHMIGAKPEARGHQLGTSITAYALNKLSNELLGANRTVRLTTDDWRLSAIKAYLLCGFQPVLYDVGMKERWQVVFDKLNVHGLEMLDEFGLPTGIIL